jgi:hypothetical protein
MNQSGIRAGFIRFCGRTDLSTCGKPKSFDGLLQRVIPVEIALVGEAVDLRFGELYQD